jgi:GPH family glycoside/pentoside/hexuronide:cation symporter
MTNPPDAIPLTAESEKLNFKTKFAYGVGELGKEIPGNILVFFLLFFLTNVAGLNPTLAGSVLLVSKVWDAINDPLIGWLSDRTRSPLGRRYPWMLWVLFLWECASSYCGLFPPPQISGYCLLTTVG